MLRWKQPAAQNRSGRWSLLLHTPARHRQATPTRAAPSRWRARAPTFHGLAPQATRKLAPEQLRDRVEYANERRYPSVRRRGADRCKIQPAAGVGGKLVLEGKARIVLLFFVLPLIPPVLGCTPIAIAQESRMNKIKHLIYRWDVNLTRARHFFPESAEIVKKSQNGH
jgi:hypothetical protein